MRTGTRFSEDYADLKAEVRQYEQVVGWRPQTDPQTADDLYSYIAGLENSRTHGGAFDYVPSSLICSAGSSRAPAGLASLICSAAICGRGSALSTMPRWQSTARSPCDRRRHLGDSARSRSVWSVPRREGPLRGPTSHPGELDRRLAGAATTRRAPPLPGRPRRSAFRAGMYRNQWWAPFPRGRCCSARASTARRSTSISRPRP